MPWRDGQGRRLRIKDPNVEVFYQYGMGQVISDRDGAGAVIAYYVRGLGGRLISNVQTAGTRYYHFDGLGSVVALTDSAGAKVSSYIYDEFGVLKQSTGQSWNNFELGIVLVLCGAGCAYASRELDRQKFQRGEISLAAWQWSQWYTGIAIASTPIGLIPGCEAWGAAWAILVEVVDCMTRAGFQAGGEPQE